MLRFLWRLLVTGWPEKQVPPVCKNHKPEIIKEIELYEYDDSPKPYGYAFVQRCAECGEIKTIRS